MVSALAYNDDDAACSNIGSATRALLCTKKKKAPIVMDRGSIKMMKLGGVCNLSDSVGFEE